MNTTIDTSHPAYARIMEAAIAVGRDEEFRVVDCSDVYRVRRPGEEKMPQGWTHELRDLAILICGEAMRQTDHVWIIRSAVQAAVQRTQVEIFRMGRCNPE